MIRIESRPDIGAGRPPPSEAERQAAYSLGGGRKAKETTIAGARDRQATSFTPPIGLDLETKGQNLAAMTQAVERFFAVFEAKMNSALSDKPEVDVESIASAFSDSFVQSSPLGVACHQNDGRFRRQMSMGLEFYRNIGIRCLKITSVKVNPLDDYHLLSDVRWRADCVKKDGTKVDLDFTVIYFLQFIEGAPRIFAAIAGDEQKSYREHGLLPD